MNGAQLITEVTGTQTHDSTPDADTDHLQLRPGRPTCPLVPAAGPRDPSSFLQTSSQRDISCTCLYRRCSRSDQQDPSLTATREEKTCLCHHCLNGGGDALHKTRHNIPRQMRSASGSSTPPLSAGFSFVRPYRITVFSIPLRRPSRSLLIK